MYINPRVGIVFYYLLNITIFRSIIDLELGSTHFKLLFQFSFTQEVVYVLIG